MFGIDDAIAAGSKLLDDVVTRIWPDATEIEKAKINQTLELAKQDMASILGQLDINKIEAAHPSVFVAGWRPALGWVGAFSLFYNFLLMPMANGIVGMFGMPPLFLPTPTEQIMSLIGGMTGLVVSRSYEKGQGVDTKRTSK